MFGGSGPLGPSLDPSLLRVSVDHSLGNAGVNDDDDDHYLGSVHRGQGSVFHVRARDFVFSFSRARPVIYYSFLEPLKIIVFIINACV